MYLRDLTDEAAFQRALDLQRQRESLACTEGARQFRAQVEKEAQRNQLSRSIAKKLVQRGIEPLATAITQWLSDNKKKRGPKALVRWIEWVGADVAAYLTLKIVLDGITKRREYATICVIISDAIASELRYRRLQAKAPGLFVYKLGTFRTSSYAHMARSMNHAVRTAQDADGKPLDMSDLNMPPRHRINLGAKLVELLTASTALVEVIKLTTIRGGKRKTTLYLESAPETTAWLTKRTDSLARSFLQAHTMPMVVPPLQWGPGQRGGFLYALRGVYPLVRGWENSYRAELEQRAMPDVYAALNALQNTAWRINPHVYSLVLAILESGAGGANLPPSPSSLPAKPLDIDTNEVARKAWRKSAAQVRDQNHIHKLRAREVHRVLDTAAEVLQEEAIFFPHSLDFRGRVYPLADYLHPQGHDLAKALLMFAQGKPIDSRGAHWLAIHGANCLGEVPEGKMSKMTLDERVEWIHGHTDQIVQVATDPLANKWWLAADEPLQFYAFAVEWHNLLAANAQGQEYICALPVSLDGSCNGLQHFSAMLRDEVGGAAVNLLPQARPQDVYQRVADTVLDSLEGLASEDEIAAKLLGSNLVTRKLTKRPTMTFGYGSKRFGFKYQLKDYLRGLENFPQVRTLFTSETVEGKEMSQVGVACGLLARLIEESLGLVVVKAAEGMKWMQRCARGIVRSGRAVEWIVPVTGFHVRQEYFKWKRQQIQTVLAGNMVWPRLNTPTTELDPLKQANAISPNVVHSLDAAALMLTVSQAAAEGVEAFAMIHDSYGTLPADCDVLVRACKQSFVRLYTSHDVVHLLHQQFAAQHEDPTKCPEPPAKGSLDVNGVLASDYFFA